MHVNQRISYSKFHGSTVGLSLDMMLLAALIVLSLYLFRCP